MDLTSILLTPQILSLAAGIVAILWGLGKMPVGDGTLAKLGWWRRLLPVMPLVLGVGGAFMPGVVTAEGWGTMILAGLWAGFVAAHGRKIIKRTAKLDKLGGK